MNQHIAELALDAALEALESHPDKYCARKIAIERIADVIEEESGVVECPCCGEQVQIGE